MTPPEQISRKIIVIDDDKAIWQAYTSVLTFPETEANTPGQRMAILLTPVKNSATPAAPLFELTFASQGKDALTMIREAAAAERPFSVAFIDIRMPPGWDGMETAAQIRQIDLNIEFVFVTAYSDRSREEIVQKVGDPSKILFLRKPFDPEELYQLALSLSEKWRIARQEKMAAASLAESESKFRALVETTNDFVWEIDANGLFVYCSPLCKQMYGFTPEELVGKPFTQLFKTDEAEAHHLFFEHCRDEAGIFHGCQRNCRHKDGREIIIETNGVPIIGRNGKVCGFRGIDRDITERLRIQEEKFKLEEQYHQAQKMEAIGTLAGGIAHDLNNLLTPILGYTEISRLGLNPDSALAKNLETVQISAQKAAGLIRQILTFSRKQVISLETFNINDLINGFIKMLRRMIREDVELVLDLADQLWPVNMDRGQVEQILMNLVVNARDAIDNGGVVIIRTANTAIASDQKVADTAGTIFNGNYVVLTVEDNGEGMDQDTIQRIFDPFFTTKPLGQGTGLGLATVYGIVRQHDGHILIDSISGKGSAFSIYLPRTQEKIEPLPASAISMQGGGETILLAEDDSSVRTLAATLLESLGYKMISAENGNDALDQYKEADGRIDLLITDVIMPGLGGNELVTRVRAIEPALPVLFVSGYPQDMTKETLIDSPNTDFIQKPFVLHILDNKIRELLSGQH